MHSTRVAIGVRVKLNENFKEKCLGDKYLKEEAVLFIDCEKPFTDVTGQYVTIKGGSLTNSGYAYLNELDVVFDRPKSPIETITMDLDKKDLIALIKCQKVTLKATKSSLMNSLGNLEIGPTVFEWHWTDFRLNNLSIDELFKVYQLLKK